MGASTATRKRFRRRWSKASSRPPISSPASSFSPDKMLQGRLFSYGRHPSLPAGINFVQPHPVNAPKCPFRSYHRDAQSAQPTAIWAQRAHLQPNRRGALGHQPISPSPADGDRGEAGAISIIASTTIMGAAGQPVPEDDFGLSASPVRDTAPRWGDAKLGTSTRSAMSPMPPSPIPPTAPASRNALGLETLLLLAAAD